MASSMSRLGKVFFVVFYIFHFFIRLSTWVTQIRNIFRSDIFHLFIDHYFFLADSVTTHFRSICNNLTLIQFHVP